MYNSDWSFLTYDLTGTYFDDKWWIEGGTDHGFIDSTLAIDSKITYDVYFLSVDRVLNDEWGVMGGVYQTNFSDSNSRLKFIEMVTYSPSYLDGIYFQAKFSQEGSDFNPPEYFAPDSKEQRMYYVKYVTRFWDDEFVFKGHVGMGRQNIDDTEWEHADDIRLAVYGDIRENLNGEVFFQTTSDGGEYDYRWNHFGVRLDYLF